MNHILQTITCPAARRTYALTCNGSGRELLRLLACEANAASTATSATISAMIHSLEVKGISEPTVVALNAFVHSKYPETQSRAACFSAIAGLRSLRESSQRCPPLE
eukprot:1691633-Pleurochrysis_carterae.AAC.1